MARLLELDEICERALRKIGSFAIRSSGSRPEEIKEARYWLDMEVGHLSGSRRNWWLIPSDGAFALTTGTASYSLPVLLGPQAPSGIQFIVSVWLHDPTQDRDVHEISLLRRAEWEAIDDKDRLGAPEMAVVDHSREPTITLYPVPNGTVPWTLRVVFQSFGNDLTKQGGRDRTYEMRQSWNLYLVTALAAQIGNGPVRKLPGDEVKDMKDEAARLLNDLQSYDDEQSGQPRLVSYHDGI